MVDVSKLYTGYSFGELALVNNEPRNATIQCLNDCYFAVLEKPDYRRVLKNIQLKQDEAKVNFMRQLPCLKWHTLGSIRRLIYSFTERNLTINQLVYE